MSKHQRRKRERRIEHARGAAARRKVLVGAGLGASLVTGATAAPAQAVTYTVDRTDDATVTACTGAANDCTLRGAVTNSNASGAVDDYITFTAAVSGQTIVLGSQLTVTDQVYIYGPGPAVGPTISGGNVGRVFNADPVTAGESVYLYYLTLTGGNTAGDGGAIYNNDASLGVFASVLTGNNSTGAAGDGGAIADGGNPGAFTLIAGSTLGPNNTAGDTGGGLYGYYSAGFVIASTISGNSAADDGGGVYTYYNAYAFDSTISGNTAGDDGGGAYIEAPIGGDTLYAVNTIISDNAAGPATGPDVYGIVNAKYSLLENPTGATVVPTGPNVIGADPQLGALQNNGGPTPTRRPAFSSPAVDKGYAVFGTDQRNFPRPVDVPTVGNVAGGDGSDIGAVELTLAEATPPPAAPAAPAAPAGQAAGTVAKKKKKCKKKKKKNRAAAAKKCKKKKTRQARRARWSGVRGAAGEARAQLEPRGAREATGSGPGTRER
jgi:hypothetical protein